MTPLRAAAAAGTAAVLLAVAGHGAMAAECLDEIEKTKAKVQSSPSAGSDSPGAPSAGQQDARQQNEQQDGQSGSASDQGSQGVAPAESWQGGTQTGEGDGAQSGVAAVDPEAARWLDVAAELANNGKVGGCWQVLVQAQRILGVIPADTPLPDYE